MLSAIVIDDVKQARVALKADIADYCPDIAVIGEADGVISGAKMVRQKSPDLVFLDIQMNDGSGFDLLEIVGDPQFSIIFTTASDEHALKAFKWAAVDYLLKPIAPDELVNAVQRAKKWNRKQMDILENRIRKPSSIPSEIALSTANEIRPTPVQDIVRCQSDNNYTMVHLTNGDQILVSRPLSHFDELLQPHGFIRSHQSHLVNLKQIKAFDRQDGGFLRLKNDEIVPVSVRKRKTVTEMLQKR